VVFDLGVFLTYLEQLTDSRKARGKRYGLAIILVMIVLVVLDGKAAPSVLEQLDLRNKVVCAG
jgi:hypothetical protein